MHKITGAWKFSLLVAVTGSLLPIVMPAQGQGIVYTISGTGNGSVAGVHFTNATFKIQTTAAVTDVQPLAIPDYVIFTVEALNSTLTIQNFGSGTFLTATRFFDNQTASVLGLSRSGSSQEDLIDLGNNAFGTYSLKTDFAPLLLPDELSTPQFTSVATSLGNVTFETARNITFSASLVSVPEPQMCALFGRRFALLPPRAAQLEMIHSFQSGYLRVQFEPVPG